MAKDKKVKTAEQKARAAAKQSKKVAKGEKKATKGASREDDSDLDDVDLEAALAAYADKQAQFLKVTEQGCDPPSPRSSSAIIASPSNRNELFIFGGEYFDGSSATFYNDLFVYLIDRGEWRCITSPNSPLPRSGHAWCRGGNAGGVFLFGGEFSSPKQGTFHHYNDFWRLDPSSREWTRLESKGKGPPARSGHRMTYFKNYILLFGGFQDTSQQTKYLQDLWMYDCQTYVWHEAKIPPTSQKPDARSSFSFLPHEGGGVLYGGYSRVKIATAGGRQGSGGPQRNILRPVVHQDTWYLRFVQSDSISSSQVPPVVRWERRKKPANPPSPARAGATMAYHKGRGILFGGVHDVEESEESIDSEFFDGLFTWNIDRNRFFQLNLRRPRATNKRPAAQLSKARNRGKADEEELLRNLAALETDGTLTSSTSTEMDLDKPTAEAEIESKPFPVRFEMPHRRFNAQLAVQDDTLFILGGTFERGDQEFTFEDLYSIDLGKLDGVRELHYREPKDWNITLVDSDDDDGEDEEESDVEFARDEGAMDLDHDARPDVDTPISHHPPSETQNSPPDQESGAYPLSVTSTQEDSRPFPRPFEALRDFYARTSNEWQSRILTHLQEFEPTVSDQSIKEIRKRAFEQAEERWWDCREEVRQLEDEQEEAGIGEVVNLADRSTEGATGGRRR